MFKQKFVLEMKGLEERVYRFECDPSSPLGELNDVLYTMKSIIVKQLNDQNEKDKPEEKKYEDGQVVVTEDCKKEEEKK